VAMSVSNHCSGKQGVHLTREVSRCVGIGRRESRGKSISDYGIELIDHISRHAAVFVVLAGPGIDVLECPREKCETRFTRSLGSLPAFLNERRHAAEGDGGQASREEAFKHVPAVGDRRAGFRGAYR